MKSWKQLSLLLLAGCLALKGCNRGGSEVENELGGGNIYRADGSPAVNARVRFYSVTFAPSDSTLVQNPGAGMAYETRTDRNGRYAVDSLARGAYNILGSLDGAFSFEDSVFISGANSRLPDDTLDEPASLSGYVLLQPIHDPRTVTVQLMGTNHYANVDKSGKFALSGLAAGRYSLRASTTLPNYTPTFTAVSLKAGEAGQLKDSLRLIYTGIPVVTGLAASYDTLQGIVTLRWNSVDYRNLEDYSVYRDLASTLVFSASPLMNLKDTVYRDTVYASGGLGPFSPFGFETNALRYRVMVRSSTYHTGDAYGSLIVQTPPPSAIKTIIEMKTAWAGDSASLGDTIRVVAFYRNPGRKLVKIKWSGDVDSTVREKSESSNSGNDGIDFTSKVVKRAWIRLAVTDEGGAVSRDSIRVSIVRDAPVADAGGYPEVPMGAPIHLHGRGSDGFGKIVKWEWDIGSTGNFITIASGDTVLTPRAGLTGLYPSILRVTDDDGETDLDTCKLTIMPWVLKSRRPNLPSALVITSLSADTLNGKIYLLEKRTRPYLSEYDPLTNEWDVKASFNQDGVLYSLLGKLYCFGFNTEVYEFNPQTEVTTIKNPLRIQRFASSLPPPVVSAGSSFFIVGGSKCCNVGLNSVESYDPAKDEWQIRPSIPYDNFPFTAFSVGNSVYALPLNGGPVNFRFDQAEASWSEVSRPFYGAILDPFAKVDGRVLTIRIGQSPEIHTYDSKTDNWEKSPSLGSSQLVSSNFARSVDNASCFLLNEKVTCFFQAKDREILAYEYGTATQKWTYKSRITTAGTRFKAFLINGKAYILSYLNPSSPTMEPKPEIYEFLLAP